MSILLLHSLLLYCFVTSIAARPAVFAPESAQRHFKLHETLASTLGYREAARALVDSLETFSSEAIGGPLRNYQVQHPAIGRPKGGHFCSIKLLEHDFGNSYCTLTPLRATGEATTVTHAVPTIQINLQLSNGILQLCQTSADTIGLASFSISMSSRTGRNSTGWAQSVCPTLKVSFAVRLSLTISC